MTQTEIRKHIEAIKDERFAAFQRKLIPTVPLEKIVGVKTPELKKLARRVIAEGAEGFLALLPHELFEENQLHAFILCEEKNFDEALKKTAVFLPHIDNWATCDQLLPKAFVKKADRLKPYIDE